MTVNELIGETLVFGIPGTRVGEEDIRLFRETHAGGLILYRINFVSPAQIRRLITDLETALERRLLVTVDHEGGRVVMFSEGVTVFPDGLAVSLGGRPADARRQGEIEGRELRRLGMDVNFAPVADVLTETHSPNIGIRSYGMDVRRVAAFVAARVRGMRSAGLSACAKHFPGLGPAARDPHLDLPVIRCGWKEMRSKHLVPFEAAIGAGAEMIMSSHPLYPRLDPSPKTPATFSRRLMTDCLRGELGFEGVLASDDLEMGALRRLCPPGRAAVLASRAGHDLLLSCHKASAQKEIYRALVEAYGNGELSVRTLEDSVERVRRLKEKRSTRFSGGISPAEREGAILSARISRKAVRILPAGGASGRPKTVNSLTGAKGAAVLTPMSKGTKPNVLIVFPRLSEVADIIMVEKELRREARFLRDTLKRVKERIRTMVLPLNPPASAIRRAAEAAGRSDRTVYFCQDAHLYEGCKKMLAVLGRASRRLTVVLLRDPYDVALAPPRSAVVSSFGYRACQIRACLEKLFGPGMER